MKIKNVCKISLSDEFMMDEHAVDHLLEDLQARDTIVAYDHRTCCTHIIIRTPLVPELSEGEAAPLMTVVYNTHTNKYEFEA